MTVSSASVATWSPLSSRPRVSPISVTSAYRFIGALLIRVAVGGHKLGFLLIIRRLQPVILVRLSKMHFAVGNDRSLDQGLVLIFTRGHPGNAQVIQRRLDKAGKLIIKDAGRDTQRLLYLFQHPLLLRSACRSGQLYGHKAVLDHDIRAKLHVTTDGIQQLVKAEVLRNCDLVGAEKVELNAGGHAVEHRFLCGSGLGRAVQRGQIFVQAVAHGQAAILDGAGVGVCSIRGDLIHRLFLIGTAHVAKSDQVGFVEEKHSTASNALIAAVRQSDLAQGTRIDSALLAHHVTVHSGVEGALLELLGHNGGGLFAQAQHGLLTHLGLVHQRGLLLGLLADIGQSGHGFRGDGDGGKGRLLFGGSTALGLIVSLVSVRAQIGDLVAAHALTVDDLHHVDDARHAHICAVVDAGNAGGGQQGATAHQHSTGLDGADGFAPGLLKGLSTLFVLVVGSRALHSGACAICDHITDGLPLFGSGQLLLAFADAGSLSFQLLQGIALSSLTLLDDFSLPGFQLLSGHFFDFLRHSYTPISLILIRVTVSARASRSASIFSITPSENFRALIDVASLAGRLTALTSNSFLNFVMVR
nr:MAG TPA: hypothetical protein [Caudoviricetes sp.]